MTLTPEQITAIQSVMTSSVKVTSTLEIPLEMVETFQEKLKSFISDNYEHFLGRSLGFVLSSDKQRKEVVTYASISKALLNGDGVFFIDQDLHLIKVERASDCLTDFLHFLAQKNAYGAFVSGSYVFEGLCGFVLCEYDAVSGSRNLPFSTDILPRPMSSFNLIINEHKKHRVDNEKGFKYWSNKSKRILKTDGGTEWIFQGDLFWWLQHYVSDAIDVVAEPAGNGQDKHDIRVSTQNGRYVVEIKWMGTNGSTTYGYEKIDTGLVQVAEYLERESLLCGHVIVYDGRSPDEHKNNSTYNKSFQHELCEPPKILFLESENPSNKADRVVKEAKNDPANK